MKLCVAYLYRGDDESFWRFDQAHMRVLPGVNHDLVILDKYFARRAIFDLWFNVSPVPRIGRDLASYGFAARKLPQYTHFVFLNSHSEPLDSGWLKKLVHPLIEDSSVGIVGATGSWDTFHCPCKPHAWLYPPYPNPHIRTNAFAISREMMLKVWPSTWALLTKPQCHYFESGRNNLTQRIQKLGLKAIIAGRDGYYPIEEVDRARVFHCSNQENLLVADNRTRAFRKL